MADIKPFVCVRPAEDVVSAVAALPYDVYNREEAKEVVAKNPKSFLAIDRAETQFPDDVDTYDDSQSGTDVKRLDRRRHIYPG